jgi:NADH:ubiquinone oxidoreductase subunit D
MTLPDRIRSVMNMVNDQVRDFNTMQYLTELINERLPRAIDELDRFLSDSEIVKTRSIGTGVLSASDAIAMSAAGPLLRASGVPYDVRRAEPYSIYPELDFDVCVRQNGDVYDRYMIRLDEMRESIRILKQILPRLEKTKGQSVAGNHNIPRAFHLESLMDVLKTRRVNLASMLSLLVTTKERRTHGVITSAPHPSSI